MTDKQQTVIKDEQLDQFLENSFHDSPPLSIEFEDRIMAEVQVIDHAR